MRTKWRGEAPTSNMNRLGTQSASCSDVAKHVQIHLDAEMMSPAFREIRKHLRRCSDCSTYLDSLKKTVFLYRRSPDSHAPAMMREKLFTVLEITL